MSLYSVFLINLFIVLKCDMQKTNDLTYYYWEDSNNDFTSSPKKSIIEFRNDTLRIIDFPLDIAGMLQYSIGTYETHKITKEKYCKIKKHITFSMNIGQVIGYIKDCETIMNLSILENGQITREKKIDASQLNEKGKWVSTGNAVMNYRKVEMNEIPIRYEWTHALENYNNEEKLKPCN
jgi:hypothetical protein